VDSRTFDDAGVYRMSSSCALVQTVDFFTPIVDDPFDYGQIAAANALSDVYAMGGRPLTAMNLMGMPTDQVPPAVIAKIIRGGATKAREAKCAIVGGHSIRAPEPLYGMAVTGIVHPRRILANSGAQTGDVLVLTKPIGTGIITTAIKRGIASVRAARRAIKSMKTLNIVGMIVGEKRLARAATDVTGYGLIGHLANICRASGVSAEISAGDVPLIDDTIPALIDKGCVPGGSRDNESVANGFTDWGSADARTRAVLTDAQTSGGLLLCIPLWNLSRVQRILKQNKTAAATIGTITHRRRRLIYVQ